MAFPSVTAGHLNQHLQKGWEAMGMMSQEYKDTTCGTREELSGFLFVFSRAPLACKGSLVTPAGSIYSSAFSPKLQLSSVCGNEVSPALIWGQLDVFAIRHQTHKAPKVFQTQLQSPGPVAKALNPPQVSAAWGRKLPSLLERCRSSVFQPSQTFGARSL